MWSMNVELRWDFYRKRKEKNVTSHEGIENVTSTDSVSSARWSCYRQEGQNPADGEVDSVGTFLTRRQKQTRGRKKKEGQGEANPKAKRVTKARA